jgi:hypothetical protein
MRNYFFDSWTALGATLAIAALVGCGGETPPPDAPAVASSAPATTPAKKLTAPQVNYGDFAGDDSVAEKTPATAAATSVVTIAAPPEPDFVDNYEGEQRRLLSAEEIRALTRARGGVHRAATTWKRGTICRQLTRRLPRRRLPHPPIRAAPRRYRRLWRRPTKTN